MDTRLFFAAAYVPLIIALGEIIHLQGHRVLQHAFGSGNAVGKAIGMLLRIGWYTTSGGLLLWNLGIPSGRKESLSDVMTEVSLRLGVALFIVGVLHGMNLLAVSLFHRKNAS